MAPILSQGNLAIITPSSTNPDLTDPKFAAQYRPAGKAIYFRTVTTDAYQGPNMADFFAEKLGSKAIYILDDQGAYGVGLADAFQKRIADKGVKVLGRDQLDPKNADYSSILTKIKSLNADSLYYGGVGTAGVKLIKQSYEILPDLKKGGGDGLYGADLLKGAGFPAMQGWYATIASPHLVGDTKLATWIKGIQGQIRLRAGRLHHHLLRRGPGDHPGHREGRRHRQARHPGRRAGRDPGRQVHHPAGSGQLRPERRHREQDRQRVPVPEGRQPAAR